ncbi:MAG: response regulator, partial [Oscillochloris sp.]|nr:response regulator [Oscillochloris sp.]
LPPPHQTSKEIRISRKLRILLVEDNPVNQEVIRRLLESLGYTPDVVGNGIEALTAVTRQDYDVVLMDIQMPELDGESATRRIRALGGSQPSIIALTASALLGDRERYLAAGMDSYLSKPVQREELQAMLDRAQAQRAAQQAPPIGQPALQLAAQDAATGCVAHLVDWTMLNRLIESISGVPAQAHGIILDLFRHNLSNQILEISAAVAADDRPRIRLLAHKLRGGSHQLGATWLAEHCLALESAAQCDDVPLAAIFDDTRHIYDDTLAVITTRLAPAEPARTYQTRS